jgi:hypothetical protein
MNIAQQAHLSALLFWQQKHSGCTKVGQLHLFFQTPVRSAIMANF